MGRLSLLVYSDSYCDRVRAGLVIEVLVSPGVTLKRRVEEITLVASNSNQRATALDIDLSVALELADRLDVELDCAVLSLVPKALMSGFQIRAGDSEIQSSAKRATDSRMAQNLLVALAMSREDGLPGLAMPSQAIWTLLYEHCFRFPIEFNPYAGLAHAIGIGETLDGDAGRARNRDSSVTAPVVGRHSVLPVRSGVVNPSKHKPLEEGPSRVAPHPDCSYHEPRDQDST